MRRTKPIQRSAGLFSAPSLLSAKVDDDDDEDPPAASHKVPSLPSSFRSPLSTVQLSQDSCNVTETNSDTSSFKYFSCVWAKKSGRKHKKWEGDAMMKVGLRSVTLMESSGKEIGRGSGYKIQELAELDDGGRLTVGGKEVEICEAIQASAWISACKNKVSETPTKNSIEDESEAVPPPTAKVTPSPSANVTLNSLNNLNSSARDANYKPFRIPTRVNANFHNFTPERRVQPGQPMFDPSRPEAVVFPRPPPTHRLNVPDRLVDIVLDPFLSKHLRPHQRDGVLFMFSNLMGYCKLSLDDREVCMTGAILADEMGLGKTLQTVALIWTMLKQSPLAGCVIAKKVLIVTPSSLLKNWEAEFRKWLGSERITIHVADSGDKVSQFRSYNTAPILMLSYELLVRTLPELLTISWDLVVCDEAHRMKNSAIKTSSSLAKLPCERRLLLTGTPVQNDLGEFYSLVDLACPGILGSRAAFGREIEAVVERSRQPDASEEELEDGKEAMATLNKVTKCVLLRRTGDLINQYLPPKTVYIVFCKPTPYQSRIYSHFVNKIWAGPESSAGQHLSTISSLKKICNAPSLLESLPGVSGPAHWEEQAGKLAALACILLQLKEESSEKVVIVSLSTSALDLLGSLCDRYQLATCRLDGSTPPSSRQSLVNNFNSGGSGSARVMLLSSKAGGTGLNLIGASRLVLYDIDWNPATDMQAMARVWRDGQKRPCHVYRLITTGTIEEKILQRQVTKRGLDSQQVVPSHFSSEELKDLFR